MSKNMIQRVVELMELGHPDAKIMKNLGLVPEEYFDIKRSAIKSQIDCIRRRTTEEVYAEYVFQQSACVRELSDIVEEAAGQKKPDIKGMIQAVKVRSDIYDKIIKTGQDFGIISRQPSRSEVSVGVVLATLSNEDLRAQISGELSSIKDMMKRFGEKNLLDIDPGKLHIPVPASSQVVDSKPSKKKKSKTNRSKANKVHKGRRAVKKKI